MALVLKDRVKETSVTTGTGTITLAGAASGYQAFSVIGNGNTTYYTITDPATGDWEVGIGTYTSSGTTLSRTTVLDSSNSGNLVNFSSGTKDVFCVYPAEKAIYEEVSGETLIDGGPITVVGDGVSVVPSLPAELGKFVGNIDSFAQIYTLNQSTGTTASADFVAYNDDTTDGYTNFTDMGISGSNYTSVDYPIFTPGSGYIFHDGDDFFIGNQTVNKDIVLFAGGADTTDEAVRISGTDRSVTTDADVNVGGAIDVTGAATFGSTVELSANPTTALQAATKQYVDNQVTAGLHIHDPVRVETTANLNTTYVQGGTTFNITDITGGNTVTTSTTHGLVVNDQIWLYSTAGNGLSTNIAYFVYSTPSTTQLTLSLTFGGSQVTGLTNASGLTYATRANSGVGATLTNAGTQAALTVDGIALSLADRVMVRLQTNAAQNGVYTVTTVGSGATNWVLTRATDSNKVNPSDPDGVGTGDYYYTQEGTLNAGDSHVLTTEPNTMIIGYTDLTFTQFSGSVDYVGGTNIDITGQTISLTGTVAATNGGTGTSTVTTGDLLYGSATNTWSKLPAGGAYKSLVMNAGGTQVEWNAVALDQSGATSGSLPATAGGTGQNTYATGDTIYASAANTVSKLAGNTTTTTKYLKQTGTGSASQAPSWDTIAAADITTGTLAVARGGTNLSSYVVGDIVYASGTGTLAGLADVATGNVLLSGGANTAPAYGKVGLGTHVSGTLPTANGGTALTSFTSGGALYATSTSALTTGTLPVASGGTGVTTSTGSGNNVLSTSPTLVTPILGTPTSVTLTNATGLPLTTGVTGTLAVGNGGTGATTLTGLVYGNGTTAFTAATAAQIVAGIGSTFVTNATNATNATSATSATTATTLATGRTIAITGDLTYTSPSFNGSANVTAAGTLATVNANVGSFTNATLTVNAKGLVTAASSGSAPVTSVTGTSPVVSSGGATPAISLAAAYGDTLNPYASKTANTALAAPDGSAGVPTFRNLQLTDMPDAWVKKSVKAATTANITLSAPQTIDGISCVAGDRVLVKNQSTPATNGIYVVAAGAWTRSADADTSSKIAGAHVNIDQGTTNGGLVWDNDFKSTDTLGTTVMPWYRLVDTGYTIPATQGGTGQTVYAVGDLVYASTTTALSKLADVATGNALISGGVGVAPSYGKIGLTTHVSGTLAVGNGGTGVATLTGLAYGNATSAFTAATAAQVVAVIGTTAVTNATNASAVSLVSTNEVNIGGSLTGGGRLYVNYNDGGSFTEYGFYGGNTTLATLVAGNFSGPGTGLTGTAASLTAGAATTATNATNVTATTSATASAFKVPFLNTTVSTTGNYGLLQDSTATFTYNPGTNTAEAGVVSASNGLVMNSNTVSASYSIPTGSSASSVGPMTVASGQTVTIASGSRWVVL